jgi:hypothetical protein
MLIRANYENDKVKALHAEPMGDLIDYSRELAKDESNGFTKDRTMRFVGRYNNTTLLAYDQEHPGWMARVMNAKDRIDRNKAWREFLNSDYGRPTMTVEALKK